MRKTSRCLKAAAFLGLMFISSGAAAYAATPAATVSVDFGSARSVAAASGFLIGATGTVPGGALIAPVQPASWRLGVYQGADLDAAYQRAIQYSQNVSFVVSDRFCYPTHNWCGAPAPWQDWTRFESAIRQIATEMKGKQVMMDVWNEPDNPEFWSGTREQFFDAYARAYRIIRSVMGSRVLIGGPSTAKAYDKAYLTAFLDACVKNKVEVNFLSWHELDDTDAGVAAVATHIRDARTTLLGSSKYASLKIGRIDINEMIGPIYSRRPGGILAYLAQIESGGADGAVRSCWNDSTGVSECFNNTLDGLLTTDFRPRAGWHLYQAYAQGYRTRTKATSNSTRVFALPSSPAAGTSVAQVLLSSVNCDVFINPAAASLDITVQIAGLNRLSAFTAARSVVVSVDRLADTGEAASAGFAQVVQITLPVTSGNASLTLTGTAPGEAYRLRIEPPIASTQNTVKTASANLRPGREDGSQTQSSTPELLDAGNLTAVATTRDGELLGAAWPAMIGETVRVYFTGAMAGSQNLRFRIGSAVAAAEAQGRIEVAPGVTANWAEFAVPELPPGRQPLLLETDGASSSTLYISVR